MMGKKLAHAWSGKSGCLLASADERVRVTDKLSHFPTKREDVCIQPEELISLHRYS